MEQTIEEQIAIDKVESLDFDKLSVQLVQIFKSEQDITAFINFIKSIQKFVNLSNDKRHSVQIDLAYFRSQIQLYEKKIKSVLDKRKNDQVKASIKKIKLIGEKVTENMVTCYMEDDSAIIGLEKLYNLVSSWSTFMNDLYFICGQTSKNLGSF